MTCSEFHGGISFGYNFPRRNILHNKLVEVRILMMSSVRSKKLRLLLLGLFFFFQLYNWERDQDSCAASALLPVYCCHKTASHVFLYDVYVAQEQVWSEVLGRLSDNEAGWKDWLFILQFCVFPTFVSSCTSMLIRTLISI